MYTEFIAASLEAQGHIEEERVAEAFDRLDSDDSGFISKENLAEFLGKEKHSPEIAAIIKDIDGDGDGQSKNTLSAVSVTLFLLFLLSISLLFMFCLLVLSFISRVSCIVSRKDADILRAERWF